jgi:penicillin-binding protein 1A
LFFLIEGLDVIFGPFHYRGTMTSANRHSHAGFFTLIFASLLGGILIFAAYLWSEGVFESEEEQLAKLTAAIIPDNSIVLDKAGNKIGEYYSFYHIQVPLDKIPKSMINALLAIEDRKFYEHEGVNWKSIGRAFLSVATSGRLKQGGSTITMQLVKNYLLTREKKVSRKLREIILAYYVEKNLSKERILELYLNTMYMGHGAYGVGAAARVYFAKSVEDLSLAESALLAGLFQAPSLYDPHKNPDAATKRQRIVLEALRDSKLATQDQVDAAKKEPLEFKPWTPINETVAPHFVAWIRTEVEKILGADELTLNDKGYKITTTLDKAYQEAANRAVAENTAPLLALQDQINKKPKRKQPERIESALLASDPKTGAILAMVGGRNFRESQFNRTISSKRSPGSVFKPVVFMLALEKGMTWADLVFVSPIDVRGFRPKNHKGEDMTEVTLLKALAKSMNTPVVSLAQKYGIKNVIERGRAMGITADMPTETGVAIGGFSASMKDVDTIYRTLANEGARTESFAVTKIEDRQGQILYEYKPESNPAVQVISPEITALMRSGLQAVLTSGTASTIAGMGGYAAGKTGTSDDSRDNWFSGFTRNIVATTWVGGDGNSSLGEAASGSSLALPIWKAFIETLISGGLPTEAWPIPDNLTPVTIDLDYGTPVDVGVTALFPKGRLPRKSQAADDIRALKQDNGSYRELKLGN